MHSRRSALRGVFLRLLVAVALALGLTFVVGSASAATIVVLQESSLPRIKADGSPQSKRPNNLTPEAVNLQDCIDDQKIRFPLTISGFEANAQIRVWASNDNDCTDQQVRTGINPRCWELSTVQLQTQINIDIPVRAILAGRNNPSQPDSSAAICGKVDLSTLNVNFLYFAPGTSGGNATSVKTVKVQADTIGPDPPTGLSVLPGNTRLEVNWVNISGGDPDASTTGGQTGGLTALTGIKIYCDAQSSTPGGTTIADASCVEVPNASDGGEAGADDAGTTTVCEPGGPVTTPASACAGANFVNPDGSPKLPDAAFNSQFECGSITGNTGTSITATTVGGNPLANGTRYAVAVAATDAMGNVGKLSAVVCETPELTTDFWQEYRAAGGQGGGCATAGELPLGSITTAAVVIAALVTSLRSRSRRRNGR